MVRTMVVCLFLYHRVNNQWFRRLSIQHRLISTDYCANNIATIIMDDACKIQYAKAVEIASRKVELKPKEESASEVYHRIHSEKEAKKIRQVKSAAKKLLKKKKMKKMTAYFVKK